MSRLRNDRLFGMGRGASDFSLAIGVRALLDLTPFSGVVGCIRSLP